MLIKFFRLSNGEDLISEYEIDGKMIRFINPYKIVYMIQPNDLFHVSLIPWVFDTLVKEKKYLISPTEIITFTEASDKLISIYKKSVLEDKKNPILPIEEELDMMDSNESKLNEEEFLKMVQDQLKNISSKKPFKGTLH